MDLTLKLEGYRLNIRAAGLIIHNNQILTHKNINEDHYCLPGGRIALGETSEETIKREMKEELGKEIKIIDYLTTIENFFKFNNEKYHEYFLLYKIDFLNEEDQKIETSLKNMEGKEELKYDWININDVDKLNFQPVCLKEIIKKAAINKKTIHNINIDKIK